MQYIPAICFAITPFWFFGGNIYGGHANMFFLSAVILLFLSEQENNFKTTGWIKAIGTYLSCWMCYIFLAGFLGKLPAELSETMLQSTFFILAGVIFYISVYKGGLPLTSWRNTICCVATIQACLAVLQVSGHDPVVWFLDKFVTVGGELGPLTPVGTLGNQNFLAAFLAISLPFFYDSRWWKWVAPLIIVALLLTKTTAAIGAAIIGSFYYFFGWEWACIGVVPAFILYALKYNNHIIDNPRFDFWLDAWRSTSHSWNTFIFGWGPGTTWRLDNLLHSEYVNVFFNYGAIGLALMIGYIVSASKSNKMLFSAFIVACINMAGNHPLHVVPSAILILALTALMERDRSESFTQIDNYPIFSKNE
jgi:hypothetical protein